MLEDSAVGIAAAEAAGMPVLVVTATHGAAMATRHPMIRDYGRLQVRRDAAGGLGIHAVAEA